MARTNSDTGISNRDGYFWREDFRNGATVSYGLAASTSGGSVNTTTNPAVGENRDGIVRLSTGATAAIDQRAFYTTNLTHFYPGDGNKYYFGVGIKTVTGAFDGTLTGYYAFGFADVVSTVGNGFTGFLSTNGGNWLCVTTNGGTQTAFDTGIAAADANWHDFAFIYEATGSFVRFYVDGVLVSISTTNINTTTNRAGLKAGLLRTSALGTAVQIDLDYIDFGVKYGTKRAISFN